MWAPAKAPSFSTAHSHRHMAGTIVLLLLIAVGMVLFGQKTNDITQVALYPRDARRLMMEEDYRQYSGAGVLFCRTEDGTLERAAAAWLIGSRQLVVLNAHNFIDRNLHQTRPVSDCFFQIGDEGIEFDPQSLCLGIDKTSQALHITDDWALLQLKRPVSEEITPQPIPNAPKLATGPHSLPVKMVSPAGHANFRLATSIESCTIQQIDDPSEDGIRQARHDCNDGYGGSGSGLFTTEGQLIAMHSASLDMNARRPFNIETHYGSAFLFEGRLLTAIKQNVLGPHCVDHF
ncbi:MAG: trypsin-like serine peptidase [Methylocella sp.]